MEIVFEPLPLVIGVTGHRDLRDEDIPLLKTSVKAIFDRLEEFINPDRPLDRLRRMVSGTAKKNAGATPMVVLSSLAEGADQLVAQVALEKGLHLVAPLPLPLEEYATISRSTRSHLTRSRSSTL
jgi:hypothetical protein